MVFLKTQEENKNKNSTRFSKKDDGKLGIEVKPNFFATFSDGLLVHIAKPQLICQYAFQLLNPWAIQ